MEKHRIKIRLANGAEFEAEGSEELVTKQFDAFMALVPAMPVAAQPAAASPNKTAAHATPEGALPQAVIDRVFSQSDTLSLAALPKSDNAVADAMLAILYGYQKFRNQQSVTGASLMKSAQISGVPIGRVDRSMESYPEYILIAGKNRAKRYQLNNRGLAKAEEVIKQILE